ncbi:hypothetical protein CEV08_04670 [Bartonella tribocorum]|uniref:Uncharacterized protein n=1 Tax=Bartonella tribocorum TaxID=85701 RepID=A0A2M6UVW4_9HYPH|nr:hypothetical protein CEV08_04670 [Bartonella tribocorum]
MRSSAKSYRNIGVWENLRGDEHASIDEIATKRPAPIVFSLSRIGAKKPNIKTVKARFKHLFTSAIIFSYHQKCGVQICSFIN